MIAALWLLMAVMTWNALNQSFQAYVIRPPAEAELAGVAGVVTRIDRPMTRNKWVPTSEIQIEVSPARFRRVTVRHESLAPELIDALEGQRVTVQFAAARPRNKWVYELKAGNETPIRLDVERRRDEAARSAAMTWAAGLWLLDAGLLSFSLAMMRRKRVIPRSNQTA
jgi:hypothetical protein